MIKFEEHDGKLFRMLEKPVPLTDDAELPVLVRMIQDNTMLGKANKRSCHPDTLAQKIICNELTDDGLFMDGNYAYRYEIIGYPVADGSAEWALYRLMQGDIVMGQYWGDDVMVTSTSSGWYEVIRLNLYGKRHGIPITDSDFLFHAEKMGWQVYTEPKPESPKEPDYVICKRCGGSQSIPNPDVSNTACATCPKCGGTGYEIKEQKSDNLYLNIKLSTLLIGALIRRTFWFW